MAASEAMVISIWQVVVAVLLTLVLGTGVLMVTNPKDVRAQTMANSVTYNTILSNGHDTKIKIDSGEENIEVVTKNHNITLTIDSDLKKDRSYFGETKNVEVQNSDIIIS